MSASITASKRAAILARVQTNPEIGTDNATFVNELIDRAADWLVSQCNLPRYPELAQGYAKSALAPSTDLSGLATNEIWVSVNTYGGQRLELTLANCTTGAATAAELQTQIRDIDVDGWDEVTVEYDDSTEGGEFYLITSGRYGENSQISVAFDEDYKDVAQSMKLAPEYGATEATGYGSTPERREAFDSAIAHLVECMYREIGTEGVSSGSMEGGGSFDKYALDPNVKRARDMHRRLWL